MAISNVAAMFEPIDSEPRTCETHGQYTANKFAIGGGRWTPCPECAAERARQAQEQAVQEAASERAAARARRQAEVLGRDDVGTVPARFREASLDGYQLEQDNAEQAKALERARWYVNTWPERRAAGTCMIFSGSAGCGKTHLACAIANALAAAGAVAMYARTYELADAVRQTYGRREATERDVLAVFVAADLLVLDEVGRQRGSDDEKLLLFKVIEARYAACRPTLLVTNADLEALGNYLDKSTRDRLREGGGKAVIFNWESYRSRC